MSPIDADIVEVVVFRRHRSNLEYLLLRRSEAEKLYPGLWQIVSGKMKGSESAVQAAMRELKEETGLQPAALWTLPFVNTIYSADADKVHLMPNFAAEVAPNAAVRLSAEHEEFRWADPSSARSTLVWPGSHHALDLTERYLLGRPELLNLLLLNVHERKGSS